MMKRTYTYHYLILLCLCCTTALLHAQAWTEPGPTLIESGDPTTFPGFHPKMIEADGRALIAYCRINNNYQVHVRRASNANGTAWDPTIRVDATNFSGFAGLDIAMINGTPGMVNYRTFEDEFVYSYAIDAAGTAWTTPVMAVPNAVNSTSPGVIADFINLEEVNGRPAFAYYNTNSDDLVYVRANDATGTSWGSPINVAAAGNAGEFLSMTIVDGRPAISYYNRTNQDLMYVRANDANGTSWGTPLIIDSAGDVGKHTSLKVVNGRPAIAYQHSFFGDLRYVRANDATGSSWGAAVSVVAQAPISTNLEIIDGNPAIAYQASSGLDDLRYVYATNINGTAWTSPVVLDDGSSNVGDRLSLSVINGKPAVAYQDRAGQGMHYTRSNLTQGILPVNLLSFRAKEAAGNVQLDWQTAGEQNNDRFEVEHSADGRHFDKIGTVAGNGTTEEQQYYEFLHRTALPGTNYYRLRQVDYDGEEEIHPMTTVVLSESHSGAVSVYPNPTRSTATVRLETASAAITQIAVYDIAGHLLLTRSIAPNTTSVELPTDQLDAGVYLLRLTSDH